MAQTYVVDNLAGFAIGAAPSDLSGPPRTSLKRNVLDSVACAVGSLDGELIATLREHAGQFGGRPTANPGRRRAGIGRSGRVVQRGAGSLPRSARHLPDGGWTLPSR